MIINAAPWLINSPFLDILIKQNLLFEILNTRVRISLEMNSLTPKTPNLTHWTLKSDYNWHRYTLKGPKS